MMNKKKIAKKVLSLSILTAKNAAGSASMFGIYQVKEPKEVEMLRKK